MERSKVSRMAPHSSTLCLENPMGGGVWQASVHGVPKSQTRPSNFPFTFHFHALEKEMATHSSVLAWRIPGTGEPGGLLSMGSHRVRHDWSDLAAAKWVGLIYWSVADGKWEMEKWFERVVWCTQESWTLGPSRSVGPFQRLRWPKWVTEVANSHLAIRYLNTSYKMAVIYFEILPSRLYNTYKCAKVLTLSEICEAGVVGRILG